MELEWATLVHYFHEAYKISLVVGVITCVGFSKPRRIYSFLIIALIFSQTLWLLECPLTILEKELAQGLNYSFTLWVFLCVLVLSWAANNWLWSAPIMREVIGLVRKRNPFNMTVVGLITVGAIGALTREGIDNYGNGVLIVLMGVASAIASFILWFDLAKHLRSLSNQD
ncbi:MAG: hypothetical protein WC400_00690 [Patescibacteria group bacterium]|jgi:hypothetical protein